MNLEEWIAASTGASTAVELHCDSVKIKTMINSSLLFLRRCESLDWSDCLVVLLLSATHFRKSGHARLIRGCFSFSQCFLASVFCSLSPPPPRSLWNSPHLLVSSGSFNIKRGIYDLSELFCAPQVRYKKWCRDQDTADFNWLLHNEWRNWKIWATARKTQTRGTVVRTNNN